MIASASLESASERADRLSEKLIGSLPYELRGKLANGLFSTWRFNDRGTLNWPQRPAPGAAQPNQGR